MAVYSLLLAVAWTQKLPTPISLASLAPGQMLVVDFKSQGCFSRSAWVLTFERPRKGRPVEVTAYNNSGKDYRGGGTGFPERWRMGKVTMTEHQSRQFDTLLAFYRERRKGSCTTVEEIGLELFGAGKPRAKEEFVDATCILDLPKEVAKELGMPHYDVMTPRQIVREIQMRQ